VYQRVLVGVEVKAAPFRHQTNWYHFLLSHAREPALCSEA
jgi:hypothetical protein